jgi:hypothetical protein
MSTATRSASFTTREGWLTGFVQTSSAFEKDFSAAAEATYDLIRRVVNGTRITLLSRSVAVR